MHFLHLRLNSAYKNWPFVGYLSQGLCVPKSLIIRDFLDFKYSDSFPWKKSPRNSSNLVSTIQLTRDFPYPLGGPVGKNPPFNAGDLVWSLVWELTSHMSAGHISLHAITRDALAPQWRPRVIKNIYIYINIYIYLTKCLFFKLEVYFIYNVVLISSE